MKIGKKRVIRRILIAIISLFVLFSAAALIGVNAAYDDVFSRADYDGYNTNYFYMYDDVDIDKYRRDELSIQSGGNALSGYLYGMENTRGLIIISPGHRDASDIKLPEIMYFVDQGWMVLCYDYTGCYKSEGSSMVGYVQAPEDLDAVLDYVESDIRYEGLSVMLFGHSLGAYASAAVLQYDHDIEAVVSASGFDDPVEQWGYSVKRSTGIMGNILSPYAMLYMNIRFGNMAHFSAIDGINSTDIPVLVMQGTTDEYYGSVSSIYVHRNMITNPNCTVKVMDEKNHNGHYDYFLSDDAVKYRALLEKEDADSNSIDRILYMDHDKETMQYINEFFLHALS